VSRAVRATIHLASLRENLKRVRALAPNSKIMAVVKADGYGHGLERVVNQLQNADAFGVASVADGQRIRALGLKHRIVVLAGIDEPADIERMRCLSLDTVIHHEEQLKWLEADRGQGLLRVWLKVDTGMHRLGFSSQDAVKAYGRLRNTRSVDPEIIEMTHFANSDLPEDVLTGQQIKRFFKTTEGMLGEKSLANSAALVHAESSHADWVRVGGLLYGISLTQGSSGRTIGFHPAMTLSTKLIAINQIAKGEKIGYGQTWQCPESMRVGVAAIGYGDGYPRQVSEGTPVLMNDCYVPIIGRISMDLITLDLRTQPNAKIGDRVILWGKGLPVERIAQASGTIGYELVCGMTRRVDFVEDEESLP
jgi:alanine racemase